MAEIHPPPAESFQCFSAEAGAPVATWIVHYDEAYTPYYVHKEGDGQSEWSIPLQNYAYCNYTCGEEQLEQWEICWTEENELYLYNHTTQESRWEVPNAIEKGYTFTPGILPNSQEESEVADDQWHETSGEHYTYDNSYDYSGNATAAHVEGGQESYYYGTNEYGGENYTEYAQEEIHQYSTQDWSEAQPQGWSNEEWQQGVEEVDPEVADWANWTPYDENQGDQYIPAESYGYEEYGTEAPVESISGNERVWNETANHVTEHWNEHTNVAANEALVINEPSELTAVEPSDALTAVDPSDDLTAVDPSDALTAVEPSDALTAVEPSDALTAIDPSDDLTVVEPSDLIEVEQKEESYLNNDSATVEEKVTDQVAADTMINTTNRIDCKESPRESVGESELSQGEVDVDKHEIERKESQDNAQDSAILEKKVSVNSSSDNDVIDDTVNQERKEIKSNSNLESTCDVKESGDNDSNNVGTITQPDHTLHEESQALEGPDETASQLLMSVEAEPSINGTIGEGSDPIDEKLAAQSLHLGNESIEQYQSTTDPKQENPLQSKTSEGTVVPNTIVDGSRVVQNEQVQKTLETSNASSDIVGVDQKPNTHQVDEKQTVNGNSSEDSKNSTKVDAGSDGNNTVVNNCFEEDVPDDLAQIKAPIPVKLTDEELAELQPRTAQTIKSTNTIVKQNSCDQIPPELEGISAPIHVPSEVDDNASIASKLEQRKKREIRMYTHVAQQEAIVSPNNKRRLGQAARPSLKMKAKPITDLRVEKELQTFWKFLSDRQQSLRVHLEACNVSVCQVSTPKEIHNKSSTTTTSTISSAKSSSTSRNSKARSSLQNDNKQDDDTLKDNKLGSPRNVHDELKKIETSNAPEVMSKTDLLNLVVRNPSAVKQVLPSKLQHLLQPSHFNDAWYDIAELGTDHISRASLNHFFTTPLAALRVNRKIYYDRQRQRYEKQQTLAQVRNQRKTKQQMVKENNRRSKLARASMASMQSQRTNGGNLPPIGRGQTGRNIRGKGRSVPKGKASHPGSIYITVERVNNGKPYSAFARRLEWDNVYYGDQQIEQDRRRRQEVIVHKLVVEERRRISKFTVDRRRAEDKERRDRHALEEKMKRQLRNWIQASYTRELNEVKQLREEEYATYLAAKEEADLNAKEEKKTWWKTFTKRGSKSGKPNEETNVLPPIPAEVIENENPDKIRKVDEILDPRVKERVGVLIKKKYRQRDKIIKSKIIKLEQNLKNMDEWNLSLKQRHSEILLMNEEEETLRRWLFDSYADASLSTERDLRKEEDKIIGTQRNHQRHFLKIAHSCPDWAIMRRLQWRRSETLHGYMNSETHLVFESASQRLLLLHTFSCGTESEANFVVGTLRTMETETTQRNLIRCVDSFVHRFQTWWRVIYFLEHLGDDYVAFEHLPSQERSDECNLLRWGEEIAHAVRDVHRAGLVHNAINVSNVFVKRVEVATEPAEDDEFGSSSFDVVRGLSSTTLTRGLSSNSVTTSKVPRSSSKHSISRTNSFFSRSSNAHEDTSSTNISTKHLSMTSQRGKGNEILSKNSSSRVESVSSLKSIRRIKSNSKVKRVQSGFQGLETAPLRSSGIRRTISFTPGVDASPVRQSTAMRSSLLDATPEFASVVQSEPKSTQNDNQPKDPPHSTRSCKVGLCLVMRNEKSAAPASGKLGRIAPETKRFNVSNGKSDVWAFGCLMFELATGSSQELDKMSMKQIVNDPSILKYGKWLRDLLQLCIQVDPNTRASMEDVVDYFYQVSDEVLLRLADPTPLHREKFTKRVAPRSTNTREYFRIGQPTAAALAIKQKRLAKKLSNQHLPLI